MENDINAFNRNDNEISVVSDIFDPETYISSKEMINAIKPMDAAIDIIGIIKVINAPIRIEKNEKTYKIFKFEMECQSDNLIPIAVWDEDIDRIKPFIMLNHVIHVDGPFARPQELKYSKDGKNYILTCRSNTIVNNLGKLKESTAETELENIDEYSSIAESIAADVSGNTKIALLVYIKTEFRKDAAHNLKGIGVVTDGSTKLTVYINRFDTNTRLEKAEYVKMIGQYNYSAKQISFEVSNMNCIHKSNREKMSTQDLQKTFKSPKKPADMKDADGTKKMKVE